MAEEAPQREGKLSHSQRELLRVYLHTFYANRVYNKFVTSTFITELDEWYYVEHGYFLLGRQFHIDNGRKRPIRSKLERFVLEDDGKSIASQAAWSKITIDLPFSGDPYLLTLLFEKLPNYSGTVSIPSSILTMGEIPTNVQHLQVFTDTNQQCKDKSFDNLYRLKSLSLLGIADFVRFGSGSLSYASRLTSLTTYWMSRLSDTLLMHFSNLRELDIRGCNQSTITDSLFQHLSQLTSLGIGECNQTTLSDCALAALPALVRLDIDRCFQTTLTDFGLRHVPHLRSLDMEACCQVTLTDQAFAPLSNLTWLNMERCNQTTITDAAFKHFTNLRVLNMSQCDQTTITDEAFRHLSHVQKLNVARCRQTTITDNAFLHLRELQILHLGRHLPGTVTTAVFHYLSEVRVLTCG
eukprot:gb/GECG01009537.1/.p1 GENE.gb/GECG01009537.1/~~gb/GECG01009537.1/.p1  ORF type:complete len:410 (+),score=20.40 gb/GECG01009537.1/:1-1230(+)